MLAVGSVTLNEIAPPEPTSESASASLSPVAVTVIPPLELICAVEPTRASTSPMISASVPDPEPRA